MSAHTAIPPVGKPRLNLRELMPDVYKAQRQLTQAAADTAVAAGIPKPLIELIRIRVSQLNGCAYCLDKHSKDARHAGESEERLYLLNAWEESPQFTDQERAALALAESVAMVADGHVPDDLWDAVADELTAEQIAGVIAVTVSISGWNRIAIPSRMTPGEYHPA
jgi:AhpD family alkylhydroperoxidase